MTSDRATGIRVTTEVLFGGSIYLKFCTPRIVIDGTVHKRRWGKHYFHVAPGEHTVEVYFSYLFLPKCGRNSIVVTVEEGVVTKVDYETPPFILLRGRLTVW